MPTPNLVEVPAETRAATIGPVYALVITDQAYFLRCPVCGERLGGEPIINVYLGVHPDDRKDQGQMYGGVIAVHALCTDLPEQRRVNGESNEVREAAADAPGFNGDSAGCLH
jgi:hypothetical protein